MSRGDRREPVALDDKDRQLFMETLGETCRKTDWQIHADCLRNNHFRLVVETRRANQVDSSSIGCSATAKTSRPMSSKLPLMNSPIYLDAFGFYHTEVLQPFDARALIFRSKKSISLRRLAQGAELKCGHDKVNSPLHALSDHGKRPVGRDALCQAGRIERSGKMPVGPPCASVGIRRLEVSDPFGAPVPTPSHP
jgi:hypothetical protein